MSGSPRVTAISVNWNSGKEIARLISELQCQRDVDMSIVVVDNGSVDDSLANARTRADDRVRFVEVGRNAGYCEGNNIGIHLAATGDAVFIVNPDVHLPDERTVSKLATFLDNHPGHAAVGPAVRRENGDLDYTESLADFATGNIYLTNENELTDRPIPWIHGCALLMNPKAVEQTGGFDERYFIVFDEVDWALRAGEAGWSVGLCPDVSVEHRAGTREAATAALLGPIRKGTYYWWRNKLLLSVAHSKTGVHWHRSYFRSLARYALWRSGATLRQRWFALRGCADGLLGVSGPGMYDRYGVRGERPGW